MIQGIDGGIWILWTRDLPFEFCLARCISGNEKSMLLLKNLGKSLANLSMSFQESCGDSLSTFSDFITNAIGTMD
jgi:hypothetical protein